MCRFLEKGEPASLPGLYHVLWPQPARINCVNFVNYLFLFFSFPLRYCLFIDS